MLLMGMQHQASRIAWEAGYDLFRASSSASIRDGQPMQRFFRDFATFRNNPVHQPDFADRASLFRATNRRLRFVTVRNVLREHMIAVFRYIDPQTAEKIVGSAAVIFHSAICVNLCHATRSNVSTVPASISAKA